MYKKIVQDFFRSAGIIINGSRPYDPQILKKSFYWKVFWKGSLGLGESYMDGDWEAEKVDEMVSRLLSVPKLSWQWWLGIISLPYLLKKMFFFPQTNQDNLQKAIQAHYDHELGVYQDMLDENLVYSCGYWKEASSLAEAQVQKVELIARKLQLRPGMRVLDIGCGFGFLPWYLAHFYNTDVTGITLSSLQYSYAQENFRGEEGVHYLLKSYHDLREKKYFDRIVSVGMFEHVHWRYYKSFMKKVASLLKDEGIFLLHTIGGRKAHVATDPWIDKYIFPGGIIPAYEQIISSAKEFFVLEDWHNFGRDYDKTLMAWWKNFSANFSKRVQDAAKNRFYRMWRFYLLSCAGAFRARHLYLWQIVFTKRQRKRTYYSVR